MIPRAKPVLGEEEKKAVLRVIESGRLVKGPECEKFEEEFAHYCGTKYAVAVNSGTSALFLSLKVLGIGNGDEVITAPNSFMATANTIELTGAKSVFVDIHPESYNIDPEKISEVITERTKVILPVHLYGQTADMDPINEIAEKHNLRVIEDACQAHGAEYKKRKSGNLGDIGCFSFYPSKNMTTGEGGMITTNDEEIAIKVKKFRNHGRNKNPDIAEIFGFNYRLNEMAAAMGRIQLKKLDQWVEDRRKITKVYDKELKNFVSIPKEMTYGKHVYHIYLVRSDKRDELQIFLKDKGIACKPMYSIPIHLQKAYKEKYSYKFGSFPLSEKHCNENLSIPIFSTMTDEEIKKVCDEIKNFFE